MGPTCYCVIIISSVTKLIFSILPKISVTYPRHARLYAHHTRPIISGRRCPFWLRVLGCLPRRGCAAVTGGRRRRSLQVGNRGPARLVGGAGYGDSGMGVGGRMGRGLRGASGERTRRSRRRPPRGVSRLSRGWNSRLDGALGLGMVERHRSRSRAGAVRWGV